MYQQRLPRSDSQAICLLWVYVSDLAQALLAGFEIIDKWAYSVRLFSKNGTAGLSALCGGNAAKAALAYLRNTRG